MKLWLIVPVKPFAEGKSRLAAVLSRQQRHTLNHRLFQHVLAQARAAHRLAGVIVVGRDPQIMADVPWDRVFFEQEEKASLNEALEQARRRALAEQADAILILPADLPLLTSADIEHLFDLGSVAPSMVIAPSQDGGTNALLLHPPQRLPFAFGPQSYARHCALAEQAGLPYQTFASASLAFDLDWPEDLKNSQ
ncbi:MAG: 2-phospho-L-lactate guanylyltransferase [Caldilineaceae bacterium]|nr:2-phospho-L-lactate guanylyltransferase [Caldilineaceae bacterium]